MKEKKVKKLKLRMTLVGVLNKSVIDAVMPTSFGIEVLDGVFISIINEGESLPIIAKKVFSTVIDEQQEITLHLLQGESQTANENMSFGKFAISGIPRAPKGVPFIEVTFAIFQDGEIYIGVEWRAIPFNSLFFTKKLTVTRSDNN